MRYLSLSAVLAAFTLPAAAPAQEVGGWEFRAGLERAAAGVCNTEGACFGVFCTAANGWTPSWFAEVELQGDGPAPDPILAIRIDGPEPGRFALIDLGSAGADGPIRRYEGVIASGDSGLLDALQGGEEVSVDPGRDYALASFALRGSRWAMTEALDLCADGGPDVSTGAPEDDAG